MNYFDKIVSVLGNYVSNTSTITLDSTFESLKLDSLDVVELIVELEEQLDIEFLDEELEGLRNLADVVKLIESKK